MDEASIASACAGATYVVHTASPFFFSSDEDQLVKPAVAGTLAAMKACSQHGVKRCVVTSSVAAVTYPAEEDKPKPGGKWDETFWSNPDRKEGMYAYPKSKVLAEKAAWDYLKKLPQEEKFELATINPGLIIGPNLNSAQFSSGDIVKKIMMGEFPGVPDISMALVDVRDCAEAHLKALKEPKAAGNRFILVEGSHGIGELAEVLHSEYAKLGYPIPTSKLPYILIQIGSLFDAAAAEAKEMWGLRKTFENKETKEVLGIKFTPMKKSALDMAKTLIQTGYIPDYEKDGKPSNPMLKLTLFFGFLICAIFLMNMLLKAQDDPKVQDL